VGGSRGEGEGGCGRDVELQEMDEDGLESE